MHKIQGHIPRADVEWTYMWRVGGATGGVIRLRRARAIRRRTVRTRMRPRVASPSRAHRRAGLALRRER